MEKTARFSNDWMIQGWPNRRNGYIPGSLERVFIDNTIHEAFAGIML